MTEKQQKMEELVELYKLVRSPTRSKSEKELALFFIRNLEQELGIESENYNG